MGLPRLKLDIRIDKMRAGAGTRVRLPCVLWLAPVTWRPLSFTSYQVGGGSITPLERVSLSATIINRTDAVTDWCQIAHHGCESHWFGSSEARSHECPRHAPR